jgi:hypothetical protein
LSDRFETTGKGMFTARFTSSNRTVANSGKLVNPCTEIVAI